jgi:hypothetical protein
MDFGGKASADCRKNVDIREAFKTIRKFHAKLGRLKEDNSILGC